MVSWKYLHSHCVMRSPWHLFCIDMDRKLERFSSGFLCHSTPHYEWMDQPAGEQLPSYQGLSSPGWTQLWLRASGLLPSLVEMPFLHKHWQWRKGIKYYLQEKELLAWSENENRCPIAQKCRCFCKTVCHPLVSASGEMIVYIFHTQHRIGLLR